MGRVNNIWFLFCLGILTTIIICQDDVKYGCFYAPKNYYFLKEKKTSSPIMSVNNFISDEGRPSDNPT